MYATSRCTKVPVWPPHCEESTTHSGSSNVSSVDAYGAYYKTLIAFITDIPFSDRTGQRSATMNSTLLPYIAPAPPPPTATVHIGFSTCGYSGYEGRTCITIDRSIYFAWIAIRCYPVPTENCIEPSAAMQQYVSTQTIQFNDYVVWQASTTPLPNQYYYDLSHPNAPVTVNTSSEYFFVLNEGSSIIPVASAGTQFFEGPLQSDQRQIVWDVPMPPASPPPVPLSAYNCTDIRIRRGWQILSFNCLPRDGNGIDILDQVQFSTVDSVLTTDDEGVLLAMQFTGSRWLGPLQLVGFRYTNGYEVYFNGTSSTIAQQGIPQHPLQNVSLYRGWNYIGHASTIACNVQDLEIIAGGWSTLDFISTFGTDGAMLATGFTGSAWLGNLETLLPGTGYDVYANRSMTFRYPANNRAAQPDAHRRLSESAAIVPPCSLQKPWSLASSGILAQYNVRVGAIPTFVRFNGNLIGWPQDRNAYCDAVGAIHYQSGHVIGSTDNTDGWLYDHGFPFYFQGLSGFRVEFVYWDSQNDTTYYSTSLFDITTRMNIGTTDSPFYIDVETTRNPCRACEEALKSDRSEPFMQTRTISLGCRQGVWACSCPCTLARPCCLLVARFARALDSTRCVFPRQATRPTDGNQ